MPGRASRPVPARSSKAKILGAGAVGLAGVLAAAPAAHAAPSDAPANTSNTDAGTTVKTTAPTAKKRIEAVYGTQKYRVGVRGKQGNYFPDGTSTAGTTLHVVETPAEGTPTSFDCTTVADDSDVVEQATFCPGDQITLQKQRRLKSVNEPTPGLPSNVYYAEPGTTVTVTQTTVNDNLVTDSSTATLAPCELGPNPVNGLCGTTFSEGNFDPEPTSTDLVFVDPGVPPVAADDSATTDEDTAVGIAIASNDTPKAPVLGVTAGDAGHGTVRLIAPESADPEPSESASSSEPAPETSTITLQRQAAGSRSLAAVTSYRAVYTPAAGFTGVDTFDYTITTANGTATATATVTVIGAPASSSAQPSDSASISASASASSSAALADTGTQSDDLIGYAAVLLAAGGGALALGRQRRRGRHAR